MKTTLIFFTYLLFIFITLSCDKDDDQLDVTDVSINQGIELNSKKFQNDYESLISENYIERARCDEGDRRRIAIEVQIVREVLKKMRIDSKNVLEFGINASKDFKFAFGKLNKDDIKKVYNKINMIAKEHIFYIQSCKGVNGSAGTSAYDPVTRMYIFGNIVTSPRYAIRNGLLKTIPNNIATGFGTIIHELSHGISYTEDKIIFDGDSTSTNVYFDNTNPETYNKVRRLKVLFKYADAYRVYAELLYNKTPVRRYKDELSIGLTPQSPSDRGYSYLPHGWYNAQGLSHGAKLDYGRWVGNYPNIWWSVALAGSTNQYTAPGVYNQPTILDDKPTSGTNPNQ